MRFMQSQAYGHIAIVVGGVSDADLAQSIEGAIGLGEASYS